MTPAAKQGTTMFQDAFAALARSACDGLATGEVLLLNFSGETTDFLRFNQARLRQATGLRQAYLRLTLIQGARRDSTAIGLSLDPDRDRLAAAAALADMRRELSVLPEDPYLMYSTEASTSHRVRRGQLPSAEEAATAVIAAAGDADLVGLLASGTLCRGFASSLGARHWHEVDSFLFDWSLFAGADATVKDKAVKCSWAGQQWNAAELETRMQAARQQVPLLLRPMRTIPPGEYRALLAPAAVDELVSMFSWGGVSAKSQRTQQSVIQRLVAGQESFSPLFTLRENTVEGLAPAFDDSGFVRPVQVELIRQGAHAGSLTNARTAREYGVPSNGANEDEGLESAQVDPGTLDPEAALATLGTGLYVSNLWYLNWSDRPSCRVTGMTRFATFWVENGQLAAPLSVMRFDDSLYRLFGGNLLALGAKAEQIQSTSSYQERSVATSRVPMALVNGLRLTL